MNWFSKLFGRKPNHGDRRKTTASRTSLGANRPHPASAAHARVADKSVSMSARAKAQELGILPPGGVAAALHLEQKPEATIYVSGVITCVCAKSLPIEIDSTPGWAGGGPAVACPDCGTRIATMAKISGDTVVVAASVEAVKLQYRSSKISMALTGVVKKQIDAKRQEERQSGAPWTDGLRKSDHKQIISAFQKYELNKPHPDFAGLQATISALAPIWQHVVWLDLGVRLGNEKRTNEAIVCLAQATRQYLRVESNNRSAAWLSLAKIIGIDRVFEDAAVLSNRPTSKEILDYMKQVATEIEAKMGTPWEPKAGEVSSLLLSRKQ